MQGMVPEMSASIESMLEKWKQFEGQEIDVFKEFGLLTTEVISRTAFGSSYRDGKHIFEMVAKLTSIIVKNVYTVRFPGIRYPFLGIIRALWYMLFHNGFPWPKVTFPIQFAFDLQL